MASIKRREDGQWRARYRDDAGREHARHFGRKTDAQRWLDEVSSSVVTGHYVDPKTARTTVEKWCETWLEGYKTRRPGTVKMARVHIALINKEFGPLPLSAVRPSMVKAWTAKMKDEPGRRRTSTPSIAGLPTSWATRFRTASSRGHLAAGRHRRVASAAALRGHDGAGLGAA